MLNAEPELNLVTWFFNLTMVPIPLPSPKEEMCNWLQLLWSASITDFSPDPKCPTNVYSPTSPFISNYLLISNPIFLWMSAHLCVCVCVFVCVLVSLRLTRLEDIQTIFCIQILAPVGQTANTCLSMINGEKFML